MKDWTALAIHYGTAERPLSDLALDEVDDHDVLGRIDYFIWIVRRAERLVLIDTGFSAEEGEARGRTLLVDPVEALRKLGVEPEDVTDVVVTHLHYDHAGNLNAFPNAVFHLQDEEMAYGTGRCMCHPRMRRPFAAEAVVDAVRLVFAGKVEFHRGDFEIEPGLSLHLIGGIREDFRSCGLETVTMSPFSLPTPFISNHT